MRSLWKGSFTDPKINLFNLLDKYSLIRKFYLSRYLPIRHIIRKIRIKRFTQIWRSSTILPKHLTFLFSPQFHFQRRKFITKNLITGKAKKVGEFFSTRKIIKKRKFK